jgi:hypothetical protein
LRRDSNAVLSETKAAFPLWRQRGVPHGRAHPTRNSGQLARGPRSVLAPHGLSFYGFNLLPPLGSLIYVFRSGVSVHAIEN